MINTSYEKFEFVYRRVLIKDIRSLPLTICFTYNVEAERRKIRNLLANGHKYKTSRTDLDINGNQIFY